uniref:helix-turn-helix domain-containing protein n=1 Tax=Thaumasiovibrio occultus TaxID=1891184 RepID=UPI000B353231|nr:AraC family transcriptional regulator [Thaumasiovibrio occultus]
MEPSLILAIVDTIEAKLPTLMSIDELAAECGFSRSYIQHQFKAATGMSINYYQRCRLLSLAAQRLAQDDSRILDVAIEFGFESQEAFARAFRKYSMVPPSRLKQQLMWAERLSLRRLDHHILSQLIRLNGQPITVEHVPAQRWGCYTFSVDSSSRNADITRQSIDNAFDQLFAEPFAQTLDLSHVELIEFNEHYQFASSTFPLSIGVLLKEDDAIPAGLLELRLPASTRITITLPDPSFVPAVFFNVFNRATKKHGLYFSDFPSFWRFNHATGELRYQYIADSLDHIEQAPSWQRLSAIVQLERNLHCQTSHWLPKTKRAGSRRLTTLLSLLQPELSSWHSDPVTVMFNCPSLTKESQYQFFVAADRALADPALPTINCNGDYLQTRWSGDNPWQLENAIEAFYFHLMQSTQYHYRAAPELIEDLRVEHGVIHFTLLTPIDSQKGSKPRKTKLSSARLASK